MSDVNRPYWPFDEMEIPLSQLNAAFSTEGLCYYNLTISQDENCGTYTVADIYAWVEFLPVEYEESEEFIEDGYGVQRLLSRAITPNMGFAVIVDEYMKKFFYELFYSSEFVMLTDLVAVTPLKVYGAKITSETLDDGLYRLTVRYKSDEQGSSTFGTAGCCRPLYEEAPYEDGCPDGGEGEGEGEPVDCTGFDVEVTREDDTLTATVSNEPAGTVITWLYRINDQAVWTTLIVNATSISLSGFGQYRAVATAPVCGSKVDQYLYNDPCGGYDVTLRRSGAAGVIAEMPQGYEAATYIWEYDDGGGFDLMVDTGAAVVAPGPGYIRVTATYGECVDQDVIEVIISDCDFDATIELDGDILTVTVEDCEDTPTFVWKLDDGTSEVTLPGTSSTLQTTASGLYTAEVTCGDCMIPVSKVVIIDCDDCDLMISIDSTGVTDGVGTLEAVITTDEDTEGITVNWDVMTPNGFVPYEHGSMTTAISENGAYRLTVTLGTCVRVKYYYNSECLDCEEYEVTITEEGGVFTASVECDTPTYNWIRMDENGDHELGITTAGITPALPGLYVVNVDCGGCPGQGRFIAYECGECLEAFVPGSAVAIAVCGGGE